MVANNVFSQGTVWLVYVRTGTHQGYNVIDPIFKLAGFNLQLPRIRKPLEKGAEVITKGTQKKKFYALMPGHRGVCVCVRVCVCVCV